MDFKVDGKNYKIGDKFFPVKNKNKIFNFNYNNTTNTNYSDLINFLNSNNFEVGRCYTNAKKVYNFLKSQGYNTRYFAGWIFLFNNLPIHHAWVAIDTGVGRGVIDTSFSKRYIEVIKNLDTSKKEDKIRKELINRFKLFDKLPNAKTTILGKVPKEIQYFGCIDNKKEAILTFNKLKEKHPNHISYRGNMNMNGRSKFQKELRGD